MRKIDLQVHLEHFLAESYEDIKTIRSFNEAEKVENSKYVLDNMISFVMKKTTAMDYDAIEMSKGNIRKLKEYETLRLTIKTLQDMKRQMGITCPELDDIELGLRNIESLSGNFELGFKLDNTTIKLMYNNIVVALICATSQIIATHMEYIKEPTGNYKAAFKRANSMSNGYSILFIKNLTQFNRKCANGEIQKFLKLSLDKRSFVGVSMVTSATILAVGLSIIPIMREIIYQYYNLRMTLSDNLRLQADFLIINQNNLKHNSKEAKSQAEIANRLIKLSDKIDVDMKTSSKRASMEVVEENKTMSLDRPSHNTDYNVSNSDNSLLI